jgi:hypothetical protein
LLLALTIFFYFLQILSWRAISSMKVERVETEDYPLEFSWLWKVSTVMQKTLPTMTESWEAPRVCVVYIICCVIAVVRHF